MGHLVASSGSLAVKKMMNMTGFFFYPFIPFPSYPSNHVTYVPLSLFFLYVLVGNLDQNYLLPFVACCGSKGGQKILMTLV
jgi:hypothetical protein